MNRVKFVTKALYAMGQIGEMFEEDELDGMLQILSAVIIENREKTR